MFKKIFAVVIITTLLLSSFYTIQLASTNEAGPDVVSAATYVAPTPTPVPVPVPKPTPVPVPKPAPVPVPKPTPVSVPITWSKTPSTWANADLLLATQKGLTVTDLMNQYNKPITRLEFTRLIVNLYQSTEGVVTSPAIMTPFKDTTSLDVAKAYSLGLIQGVSATNFNPNGLLTRQESALIFQREWLKIHPTYKVPALQLNFSDSSKIATWAKEASLFMVSAGLMKGNDLNQLDPLGNATREQAMVLVLRSFQKSTGITTLDAITSATGTSTYPDAVTSATGTTNYEDEDEDEYEDD